VRGVLHFLNTAPVLQFLEKLTGIDGVIPDPYYQGGGLHQIEPGGRLSIHTDFAALPNLRIERRLNLILYLNKDWEEAYGGHLELWQPDMSECVHKVLPVFNRCVVFTISDDSWHGHPTLLACPQGMTRRSLATYYYTSYTRPEELAGSRRTTWRARPGSSDPRRPNRRPKAAVLRSVAGAILPPIVVHAARRLSGRK